MLVAMAVLARKGAGGPAFIQAIRAFIHAFIYSISQVCYCIVLLETVAILVSLHKLDMITHRYNIICSIVPQLSSHVPFTHTHKDVGLRCYWVGRQAGRQAGNLLAYRAAE